MLILLLLINIIIPRIFSKEVLLKPRLLDDCTFFEYAVKYLGHYQDEYSKVSNCCDFNAITCDNQQNIIEIKLINIDGLEDDATFGINEFQNFKNLAVLELNNVRTGDNIPYSIFELKNLKSLDLSHNYFSGSIPQSFCNLKQLKHL
ncbi:L domain-like protein [Anaeromyces robustus]|uniref:L domain-like protein n=1 Tax=Anaeromyces robustus TaxID=1754192 RepID=A0A1Y1XNB2_9FUNG|nr:L domain-like protein [Anaeromyces robustus]|eukprot:ORX87221.1 L domain-like protein [Anaeromyces robustus]